MGVMEGRSAQQIKGKYTDLYGTALLTNWKIWPAAQVSNLFQLTSSDALNRVAQLVNFRYMPLPYRVPFQSACGVFWTLYLSVLNSK